jgi:hypothetical protein
MIASFGGACVVSIREPGVLQSSYCSLTTRNIY